jgi:hypothetical protein
MDSQKVALKARSRAAPMAAMTENSTVVQKVSRWVASKENSMAVSMAVRKAHCWVCKLDWHWAVQWVCT